MKDESIEEILDIDDWKENVKKELREYNAISGKENLSDLQIDKAAEIYISRRGEFKSAKNDLSYKFAKSYINRGWIAKRIIAPAAAVVIGIAVVGIGAKVINHANLKRLERQVEGGVERSYSLRSDLEVSLNSFSSSSVVIDLPESERNQLKEFQRVGLSRLTETDSFFEDYCLNGQADEFVNEGNYKSVGESLARIDSVLGEVDSKRNDAFEVLKNQEIFALVGKNLENLMTQVKTAKPAPVFLMRAEKFYADGVASIKNRNLAEAQNSVNQLTGLRGDIDSFQGLLSDLDKYSGAIEAVAIEQMAKDMKNQHFQQAQNYVRTADVANLRDVVGKLQNLEAILKQDYKLLIVENGMTGFHYESKKVHGAYDYFVVVEAYDSNHSPVNVRVIDEYDNRYSKVTNKWAERIPGEVFERIKEDKMDNDRLDNSTRRGNAENRVFGEKRKGYLDLGTMLTGNDGYHINRLGQLTYFGEGIDR